MFINHLHKYYTQFQPYELKEAPQIFGNQLRASLDTGCLEIINYGPSMVRIRLTEKNSFLSTRPWTPFMYDRLFDQHEDWHMIDEERFSCGETTLIVHQDPLSFELKTNQFMWFKSVPGQIGLVDDERYFQGIFDPFDVCYGMGEPPGLLEIRGRAFDLFNREVPAFKANEIRSHISVPFFMLIRHGYFVGFLLNSSFPSRFDLGYGDPDAYTIFTQSPDLDFTIFQSSNVEDFYRTLSKLVGRTHFPPYWSLGLHQSRYSYQNDQEFLDVTDNFRKKNLPCDVIYFDIHYMHDYRVFTWDPNNFPNPQNLHDQLHKKGFRTVAIVNPGIKYEPEGEYKAYQTGVENDCFIRKNNEELFRGYVWPGESVFPDFFQDHVQKWWQKNLRALLDEGVSGIWNDMNEPAMKDGPFYDIESNYIHIDLDAPQGPKTHLTNHRECHNLYASLMSQASHQGVLETTSQGRAFILSRSGFLGIQQHSALWTGDNFSSWEHLEMSLPMLINLGLSGIPMTGADIGGFLGHCSRELYVRWMELGIFYPFMRVHSDKDSRRREPWAFGQMVEDQCRFLLELRYMLLPTLYSALWKSHREGLPILKPLFWEDASDVQKQLVSDQAFFGDHLMIAPIVRPNQIKRMVVLPKGHWYHWWTKECYSGGQEILAASEFGKPLMLVRAGAALLLGKKVSSIPFEPSEIIEQQLHELWLFPLKQTGKIVSKFHIDDGLTHVASESYKSLDFQVIIRCDDDGKTQTVECQILHHSLLEHPDFLTFYVFGTSLSGQLDLRKDFQTVPL
jgi:alpha-glucosidase